MPFVAPFGSAPRVFCVVFVNFYLHFSLFLHCFSRKILIFCSLRATIITFITIIPQFAAIFKCFPLANANKPSKHLDISLKTSNFSPKTLICHFDNKNRHLMPRSPCTIKLCQRICCFFLCFYPPDFYLFDI